MAYNILKTLPAVIQTALGLKQNTPRVVTSSTQASIDEVLHVTATSTITDPASPTEGKGFEVVVRNGTATVGGTAYSQAGLIIRRIYHSGSYTNYVDRGGVSATDVSAGVVQIGGTATGNAATVIKLGAEWRPDVINQGAASHSGSGAVSVVNQRRRINTGTTAASRGGLTWIAFHPGPNTGTDSRVDFTRAQKLVINCQPGTSLDGQSLVRIALAQQTTGALSSRGYGIELRAVTGNAWAVWGVSHNGTSLTETDLGLTLSGFGALQAQVISDGSGNMVFWANGAILATASGGPSTTVAGTAYLYAEVFNGTEAGSRFFDLANAAHTDL
jgi:hypothetical protein